MNSFSHSEFASFPPSADRRRGGLVSFLVIGTVVIFLTMVSFTVSTGEILIRQQKLQDFVDATALAGAAALRDGDNALQAVSNAVSLASEPSGAPFPNMTLSPGAVEVGRYDFINHKFISTASSTEGVPAVRVVLPLSVGLGPDTPSDSTFIMSSFLRDQLGLDEISLHAEAIAVVRPRDIVIVQDITGSFIQEFEYARSADLALVEIIANSYGGLGDRIGVVTFGRKAYTEFPLTPVAEGAEDLTEFLGSTMEVCTTSSQRHQYQNSGHRKYDPLDPNDTAGRRLRRVNCQGTGTGPGLVQATSMLDAAVARGSDPVIVLLTDGVPCHYSRRLSPFQWVERGKVEAIDAAIEAKLKGIRIFVVNLSLPPYGPEGSCSSDGSAFNIDLASHGYGMTTDDPSDLEQKLLEVANKLTLRLVQ
ncbi:MAG: VWA domain-containing protein [Myxococcota bacterium]|nr:VWA domain-containing protein [Myxococcota bacterium]